VTDRYQDVSDTPPPVALARRLNKVDELIRAGGDSWKEQIGLYRRPPQACRSTPGRNSTSTSTSAAEWYDCLRG
jgi:hypothetical protein